MWVAMAADLPQRPVDPGNIQYRRHAEASVGGVLQRHESPIGMCITVVELEAQGTNLALQLGFDTVVPGHGTVTTKQELQKFRESTLTLRTRVHDMVIKKSSRAEIEKMLRSEFHFADLHVQVSLDGLIKELQ